MRTIGSEDGAAMGGGEEHEELVELLLEMDAKVNVPNNNGSTALCRAAWRARKSVVQLLVEKRADVNAVMMDKGGTALHWATEKGHEAVVRLLVEGGADNNAATTDNGSTALH